MKRKLVVITFLTIVLSLLLAIPLVQASAPTIKLTIKTTVDRTSWGDKKVENHYYTITSEAGEVIGKTPLPDDTTTVITLPKIQGEYTIGFGVDGTYSTGQPKAYEIEHTYTFPGNKSNKVAFDCSWRGAAHSTMPTGRFNLLTGLLGGGASAEQENRGTVPQAIAVSAGAAVATAAVAGAAAAASGATSGAAATVGAGGASGVPGVATEPIASTGDGGEQIVTYPDGKKQITYPKGAIETTFPNGTTQIKLPDGTVRDEWPDGTVTGSLPDGTTFIHKPDASLEMEFPDGSTRIELADGTVMETVFDPATGETQLRYPDGTREITKRDGTRLNVDASNIITSVTNPDGYNVSLQPDGSVVLKSPFGGSATQVAGSSNFEGTIITKDGHKATYKPGSRIDVKMKDGSTYQEHEDGTTTFTGIDGTKIKHDTNTDALEASWADGSYVKKDANGNIQGKDASKGIEFTLDEDKTLKMHDAEGNQFTATSDGTKQAKTADGWSLTERADGSVEVASPSGGSLQRHSDGSITARAEDGSLAKPQPDGSYVVTQPDGTSKVYSEKEFKQLLAERKKGAER